MGKYSVVGQTSSELVDREGVVYHIHADLLQWNDGSRQWYGYCIVNNQWHSSIGYFESKILSMPRMILTAYCRRTRHPRPLKSKS